MVKYIILCQKNKVVFASLLKMPHLAQEIAGPEDRSIFIMSLSVLENLTIDSVVITTSYQMQFKSSSLNFSE